MTDEVRHGLTKRAKKRDHALSDKELALEVIQQLSHVDKGSFTVGSTPKSVGKTLQQSMDDERRLVAGSYALLCYPSRRPVTTRLAERPFRSSGLVSWLFSDASLGTACACLMVSRCAATLSGLVRSRPAITPTLVSWLPSDASLGRVRAARIW